MKIVNYYKYFGLKETINKIFRYTDYLRRFKCDSNYYVFTKHEKEYVCLKNKSVYFIAYSYEYSHLEHLINVFNLNGYKVVFCSYDNIYLKQKFLNISEQIKYNDFVYENQLIISYKIHDVKNSYCIENQDISNLDNCNNLFSSIVNNSKTYVNGDLISIVVLNYNNDNIIFKCINSIMNHSKRYNYELIIIDNNSNDGSYEKLKRLKNIRLYRNNKNGCSSGRNIGILNSYGKYLLFLDSDQYPLNDYWLDNYLEIICNNSNYVIGWAAGWLNNKYLSGKTVDFYEYRYMPPAGLYRSDIGYLGTGGMFGLKDSFDKTDYFDENYDPTCYEDTDISFQLKNVGVNLIYSPCLGIIHDEHQTTHSGSVEHLDLINKKGFYFRNKWSKINLDLLKNGVK